MNKKLWLLVMLSLPIAIGRANAQYCELAVKTGMTDLWADIGNPGTFGQLSNTDHYINKQYWKNPKAFIGGSVKYKIVKGLWVRFDLMYGTLYAADNFNSKKAKIENGSPNLDYLLNARNFDVKTPVEEGIFLAEMRPFEWFKRYTAIGKSRFSPYLCAGIGLFHFNPKGSYYNPATGHTEWVNLHDLHLEGQGFPEKNMPKEYKLTQVAIPVGFGVNYAISKKICIGFEVLYRFTSTDYLDDVSNSYIDPALFDKYLSPEKAKLAKAMYNKSSDPYYSYAPSDVRGTPQNKDGYSTFACTFSYRFWPSEKIWRNYW